MSQTEWDKQCEILNNFIIAHNMPLDEGWALMRNDFYNIASANHVDNATLFVAYMNWLPKTSDKSRKGNRDIVAVRRSNRLLKRIVTVQNGFTNPLFIKIK